MECGADACADQSMCDWKRHSSPLSVGIKALTFKLTSWRSATHRNNRRRENPAPRLILLCVSLRPLRLCGKFVFTTEAQRTQRYAEESLIILCLPEQRGCDWMRQSSGSRGSR